MLGDMKNILLYSLLSFTLIASHAASAGLYKGLDADPIRRCRKVYAAAIIGHG